MLKVDLGLLARRHRIRIDVELAPDDPSWDGADLAFDGTVAVELDAQQAGPDVVVRGTVRGTALLACRRCTTPVRYEVDEAVTLVYRPGLAPADAEAEETYVLPERAQDLDLWPALLEHLVLAVPQFVVCREDCRGFCPRCGTNLNQASCDCVVEEDDPRWAALRRLRTE
jgi:uncharacterized protein